MATLEDTVREMQEILKPDSFERQEPFTTMEEREGFIPPPDSFGAVLPRDIPRDQLPGLRPKATPRELPDVDLSKFPRITPEEFTGVLSRLDPRVEERFFSDSEFQNSFFNEPDRPRLFDPIEPSPLTVEAFQNIFGRLTPDDQDKFLNDPEFQRKVLEKELNPSSSPRTTPTTRKTKASRTGVSRLPTLQNYLSGQTNKLGATPTEQNISPLLNQVGNAVDPTQGLHRKFRDLGKVSPGDAAYKGAMLGGAIGLDQAGPAGALMGSGIGSMFARGIGDVESGRAEAFKRRSKVVDVFNKLGVAEKDGAIKFKDVSFVASPDEAVKLKNTSTLGSPTGERSTFAIDKANPFSNRTTKMARGLALALNNGLLNYSDLQDPKNLATLDAITGYLVNAATKDVISIDTAKDRLKDIMKRMKLDEKKLRGFLESIKGNLPENEALAVKEGLELLYN